MLLAMTEEPPEFMKRSGRASPHDRRATERWVNEGGHVASDAVLRTRATHGRPRQTNQAAPRRDETLSQRPSRAALVHAWSSPGAASQDWRPCSRFTHWPRIAWI